MGVESPSTEESEEKRTKTTRAIEFCMADLDHWSKDKIERDDVDVDLESTQVVEMSLGQSTPPRMVTEYELLDVKKKLAETIEDNKLKEAKIKSLEETLSNNKELLNIARTESITMETTLTEKEITIKTMKLYLILEITLCRGLLRSPKVTWSHPR